jgi:coenzyme F420-reducing hydrogenase delta subunit/NAD-dependent dihydropyrimidine dehydrogenase PreA subunit
MSRPPTISNVVHENCDGCAYCVDPCPTRSITLLEFIYLGEIKKVVEVSERTCIGCGICMSTCPKKGIDVKHYKLESFSEMVKAGMENDGPEPVIICFCCNRCAYPAADAAGSEGIQYPANVRIIRTVCSGMIHPNIVMDALTQGTDGVLLCGCHLGNCRSRKGIRKALDRKEAIELMLEDFGLEPERFRLEHVAASESRKFAKVVKAMSEELTQLGPSPYRQDS